MEDGSNRKRQGGRNWKRLQGYNDPVLQGVYWQGIGRKHGRYVTVRSL